MTHSIYLERPTGGTERTEATDAQLAAISRICGMCRALCCRCFQTCSLRQSDDGDYTIDRNRLKDKIAETTDSDTKRNLEYTRDHFFVPDGKLPYMTCDSLTKDRCGDYKNRPPLCRGYICGSAWYKGHPPEYDSHQMAAASKDGPVPGWNPIPGLICLSWETEVRPGLPVPCEVGSDVFRKWSPGFSDETLLAGVSGFLDTEDTDLIPDLLSELSRGFYVGCIK